MTLPQLPPNNPVDFDDPPVAEVAMAVQFDSDVTDATITLRDYWPKIQARYPNVEQQPPLPPMSEDFGPSRQPSISVEFLNKPPAPRYWFLTENQAELIQVQPDRFAFNWRKEPPEAPYPRYEHLRSEFIAAYAAFLDTVQAGGRNLRPNWCEITYINPIPPPAEDTARADLSSILKRVSPDTPRSLPNIEDTTLSERYLLYRGDEPMGRFHISATPAVRTGDLTPVYVLNLVARGLAESADLTGIVSFMDKGRELIVKSFAEMTTPAMHKRWGLQ